MEFELELKGPFWVEISSNVNQTLLLCTDAFGIWNPWKDFERNNLEKTWDKILRAITKDNG